MRDREREVAVIEEKVFSYPVPPFNPPQKYPEFALLPYGIELDPDNQVYRMVRQALQVYGLEAGSYDTADWNPLSGIVSKGDTVAIKPNLVWHTHPLGEKAALSTVTHASTIRPIVDYAILALRGQGRIVICDAPVQSANFRKVCDLNGLTDLVAFYQGKRLGDIQVCLLDLRRQERLPRGKYGIRDRLIRLEGDPLGYSIIDLGRDSYHSEIAEYWQKYEVAMYDLKKMRNYHTNGKHCYHVANTVLSADAIVSVPKLKTHKKAGISVCLKNSIGINSSKDFLPHHRKGIPAGGGDEYPARPARSTTLRQALGKVIDRIPVVRDAVLLLWKALQGEGANSYETGSGNWQGNDTIWRTILDLNTIVRYADKKGVLQSSPQRKLLFLVDGIVAQEDEGPLSGRPRECGLLALGTNPCATDYVAAREPVP